MEVVQVAVLAKGRFVISS
ncbi:unnamed protein product [Calypogeia fissa]